MTSAFEMADRFVAEACELHPTLATRLGVRGSDAEWGPWGLEGATARADLATRYLSMASEFVDDPDSRQALSAKIMLADLRETVAGFDEGEHFEDLRHMASGFQAIRSVFDVMPTDSPESWVNIVSRLASIDEPVGAHRRMLEEGVSRGEVVAARQVKSVIRQARVLASEDSSYLEIAEKAAAAGFDPVGLNEGIDHVRAEMAAFADWLESDYLSHASAEDAVGEERYVRAAGRMLGTTVDPHETYEWGWSEVGRLLSEMKIVGASILPGAGVLEVKGHLEDDPTSTVRGTDALVSLVSQVLDAAVDQLAGSHFDVPDAIRPLTVQIAPRGGPLGVYYVRPSEDLSRPGGVWYSIGEQEVFPTYQHVSTAYHEGFPGHHLQLATAIHKKEELSRYQRSMVWVPGFGEGWAMYSEVLMGELGFLDDPRYRFGMLAKQLYRAARVVVDIGLHLGKTIASSSPLHPGEKWSFERAASFMEIYGFRTTAQASDEVLRYLGWPGQAITYKVGERAILDLRAETRHRLGSAFDLKSFHSSVIGHGTLRLDMLADVVGRDLR